MTLISPREAGPKCDSLRHGGSRMRLIEVPTTSSCACLPLSRGCQRPPKFRHHRSGLHADHGRLQPGAHANLGKGSHAERDVGMKRVKKARNPADKAYNRGFTDQSLQPGLVVRNRGAPVPECRQFQQPAKRIGCHAILTNRCSGGQLSTGFGAIGRDFPIHSSSPVDGRITYVPSTGSTARTSTRAITWLKRCIRSTAAFARATCCGTGDGADALQACPELRLCVACNFHG